jgi:hypothetical protein
VLNPLALLSDKHFIAPGIKRFSKKINASDELPTSIRIPQPPSTKIFPSETDIA